MTCWNYGKLFEFTTVPTGTGYGNSSSFPQLLLLPPSAVLSDLFWGREGKENWKRKDFLLIKGSGVRVSGGSPARKVEQPRIGEASLRLPPYPLIGCSILVACLFTKNPWSFNASGVFLFSYGFLYKQPHWKPLIRILPQTISNFIFLKFN